MAVLPIGQLLGLGDLLAKTDGEEFLQAHVENTVLGHHLLYVDAVGGREIAPAPQAVDVVLERQPHFADRLVGEEIRQLLRHADMRQTEEIAPLVTRDLDQSSGVVDASLETGTRLGVHAHSLLCTQIRYRFGYLLLFVHNDHFAFERRNRHPLQQVLIDMMRLISHAMRVKQIIPFFPNDRRTPGGIAPPHRS